MKALLVDEFTVAETRVEVFNKHTKYTVFTNCCEFIDDNRFFDSVNKDYFGCMDGNFVCSQQCLNNVSASTA